MSVATSERYLTTGQVARACGVASRTAAKWIDSGLLKGFKIPGSRDRRVAEADLLEFKKVHGIPLHALS